MKLLPPAEGKCAICAVDHPDGEPHDAQSLYYQYRFQALRGRWPTWADAIAHCHPDIRKFWEMALREKGYWSEPEDGEPIADPPNESIRQIIENDNNPMIVEKHP